MTTNLEKRLAEHNSRVVKSTKHNAPYNLIYFKSFNTRLEARDHEKFLKIRCSKERILKDSKFIK